MRHSFHTTKNRPIRVSGRTRANTAPRRYGRYSAHRGCARKTNHHPRRTRSVTPAMVAGVCLLYRREPVPREAIRDQGLASDRALLRQPGMSRRRLSGLVALCVIASIRSACRSISRRAAASRKKLSPIWVLRLAAKISGDRESPDISSAAVLLGQEPPNRQDDEEILMLYAAYEFLESP
jgi:hypothetical protein